MSTFDFNIFAPLRAGEPRELQSGDHDGHDHRGPAVGDHLLFSELDPIVATLWAACVDASFSFLSLMAQVFSELFLFSFCSLHTSFSYFLFSHTHYLISNYIYKMQSSHSSQSLIL